MIDEGPSTLSFYNKVNEAYSRVPKHSPPIEKRNISNNF
jgi:hypothetical protein